jgi:hypothetical protein
MSSPKKNKTEKRLETLAVKTKQQKQAFLEQLPKYPIVQVACEKSGVGRSTYYVWRKEDKEFAKLADEAVKSGTYFINDMAESKLIQNIQNGNNTAIIFWLKNHHTQYSERIRHEHEFIEEELTQEQKIAIAKALFNSGHLTSFGRNNMIRKAGGTAPMSNPEEDAQMNETLKEAARRALILEKEIIAKKKEKPKIEEAEEDEEIPPQPQTMALPKGPPKPEPSSPVYKKRIPLSKRKPLNLKEFFRKREEEKRRLEGK